MTHRRTWQAVRTGLATVLFVPALVLLPSTAALACSCAAADTEELLGYVDTVAVGELTAVDPPPGRDEGSLSQVTYTAVLDAVFKGDPDNPLTFRSASHGASCGLEGMSVGRDYVFFVRDGKSGLCDGTAPATERLIAEVEAVTGPGQQVAAPDPGTAAEPAPDEAATATSAWVLWSAVGLGTVGLLALGWLVWRRAAH